MMLFFPEGTRNRNKQMKPFKKGPFHMAIDCQCPIYPVVVSPFFSYDYDNQHFDSGTCRITVLPPIVTKGLARNDVDKLLKVVEGQMQLEFNRLWDETQSICEKI